MPDDSFPAFPGSAATANAPLRVVVADDNPVVRAGLTVLLSGREDIEVVAEAADGREAYEAAHSTRPDVVLLDVRMPGVDGISALPHIVRICPVLMLTYSRESEIVHEALRLGAGGYLVHGEFTAGQLVAAVRDIGRGRAHFTPTAANAILDEMRRGPAPVAGRPLPEGLGAAYQGDANAHEDLRLPEMNHAAFTSGFSSPPPKSSHSPMRGVSQLQSNVPQSSVRPSVDRAHRDRLELGLSAREMEIMDLIASGMSNHQIAASCFISEKTVKNHINRIFAKLASGSRSEAIAKWLGTMPSGGIGRGVIGHG